VAFNASKTPIGLATQRYTRVAIGLHWLIAALLALNIAYGLQMERLRGPAELAVFQLHKSVGITVLILTLARIGWRLSHRPPAYHPPLKGWEKWLSKGVHLGFYAIMLALPLTGWAIVSSTPITGPTLLYGVIPWPHLPVFPDLPVAAKHALQKPLRGSHHLLVRLTYALIALHLAGALKHALINRDAVLHRMIPLPFLGRKPS
jgi:cytochrome b561